VCFAWQVDAADIVRYVDTGADAGGDGTTSATSSGDNTHAYQSLNAWEAAEGADLDTANNTHTVHCNRTNGGGVDQLICEILGWTTSATDDITVIADDFPTDGKWDSSAYILENNDDQAHAFNFREEYVTLRNLQILLTTTSGTRQAVRVESVGASNYLLIDSCIIRGVCSGAGVSYGLYPSDADTIMEIVNTVIYGFVSGADTDFRAVRCRGTISFYNCTIFGNYTAINQFAETCTMKNCVIFNNTDDFSGTITCDYCASDDANASTYTNGEDFTAEATDWNKVFTGYSSSPADVTLKNYTTNPCCVGEGDDTPGSTFSYSDDIIGTARTSVWDIGAFELVAAAPAAGQVIRVIEH
jgi:hypothetical protein